MKPTTGYETNRTENNIIRGHTYVTELTKTIPNLGLTEIPDEFFLGWINPYLLSDCMKSTGMAITGVGDDEGIEFVPPTYTTNIPMGYMYASISSGSHQTMLWTEDGGTLQMNASSNSPRFIKKFYPECYSLVPNSIMLGFDFNYYTPPPSSQLQNANDGKSITLNFGEFKQFVRGQFSKEITFTWNSFNMKVTLTGTDFTDGTAYKTDENGSGYEFRIFLRRYSFNSFYGGEYAQTSGYAIIPMIRQNVEYSFSDSSEDFTVDEMRAWTGWTGTASLAQLRINTSTHTIRDMTPGTALQRGAGACQSSIKFKIDVLNSETLLFGNGIVGHKTSGYIWNFYAYYKIDEIEKMLNLFARVSKYTIVSYTPDDSFATRVDSNDEFLAELHSGNIQDQSFRESLRDWQYVPLDDDGTDDGTAKNEFIESDMPPYDPTPPTPPTPGGEEGHNPDNPELSLGDTEDVPGDSVEPDESKSTPIQFPVSAFMTQYVLTANQIYNMGRALWSGMGDSLSQMASNFVKTYTSTGTINIANLMDFFVSVKCFPFDMTEFNYGWQAPAMTVGTGAVPILNESVWVLGVSTYVVDCGTVATTDKAFKLGVNSNSYDFRNYVNCTISCFLPFCGTVELNPADVFPYTLSCKYFIDMLSGSCTAVIWSERPEGSVPVASKTGQIGKIVPISATNVMGVVGQAISGVSNIFQTVGEVVISAAKRRALGATQAPINEASKNKEYLQEMANYNKSQTDISNKYSDAGSGLGVITGATSGIGNLMTRNGVGIPSLGAGVGLEAMHISERPYIVIRRLNYSSPNNYAHTTGFASTDGGGENNKSTIGAYSGWTVFQNVDLSGIYGTKEELEEIKMLLETGVYL